MNTAATISALPDRVETAVPDEEFIPPHGPDGLLPYCVERRSWFGHTTFAPYRVSLATFAERFARSPKHVALLRGLLEYRRGLHARGLVHGLQWIGGSFVDDAPRPPSDLDLVTFYAAPASWSDEAYRRRVISGAPELFQSRQAKRRYGCDGYFVDMSHRSALMRWTYHWHALYGHTKTPARMPKGFIEVPLAPHGDDAAATRLEAVAAALKLGARH